MIERVDGALSRASVDPFEQLVKEVADDFGISESEMWQNLKIAAISPDAVAAILVNGLADDREALEVIAEEPRDQQLAMVEWVVSRRRSTRRRIVNFH